MEFKVGDRLRIKTKEEFENEFGKGWRGCVQFGWNSEMNSIMGKEFVFKGTNKFTDSIIGHGTEWAISKFMVTKVLETGEKEERKMIKEAQIEKIIYNEVKHATTVIFTDGDVIVVKKQDDAEHDIYSAVASAVAQKVYGSNSAFKKVVKEAEVMKRKKKLKRGFYVRIDKKSKYIWDDYNPKTWYKVVNCADGDYFVDVTGDMKISGNVAKFEEENIIEKKTVGKDLLRD